MRTAVSCKKGSQVAGLIHIVGRRGRSISLLSSSLSKTLDFDLNLCQDDQTIACKKGSQVVDVIHVTLGNNILGSVSLLFFLIFRISET